MARTSLHKRMHVYLLVLEYLSLLLSTIIENKDQPSDCSANTDHMDLIIEVHSAFCIYFLLYAVLGISPSQKQLTEAIIGTEKAIQG